MKILVVDDSPTHAHLCRLMFNMIGEEAEFSQNGKEALELLKREHFDCILTDCLMPEMNGFDLAKQVRSSDSSNCKDVYIIGMSGSSLQEHLEKCLQSGMNDFCEKPITKQVLLKALEKYKKTKVSG